MWSNCNSVCGIGICEDGLDCEAMHQIYLLDGSDHKHL